MALTLNQPFPALSPMRPEPSLLPPTETVTPRLQAARRAARNLIGRQRVTGDWEGEMVWCTMITAQAVIVRTLLGRPYGAEECAAIRRYFEANQRDDGAWGMHPESGGYVFFTAITYVALRLLGAPADAPPIARARQWLRTQSDGVKAVPSWGKFWLAMLDLYGWEGVNPIPPEIFLLPAWAPVQPRRFYCHTRLIYLGLAYLFGIRFRARLPGNLRDELRDELYPESYASIDFAAWRCRIAATDVHVPISPVLKVAYGMLRLFERCHGAALRRKALRRCFDLIGYEQRQSGFQGISPVSGLLNCLVLFAQDSSHPDLQASLDGVEAWRWEDAEEGLRYVGARSNSWDTAFAIQALCELPDGVDGHGASLRLAHDFLDRAQLVEELPAPESGWRDPVLGGWCFSDGAHRWPVSDCAAEALSALLMLYAREPGDPHVRLDANRLRQAVDFILARQNADGGFGTYERRRGGRLLELINPSEMYGQCMTELSYIECTSSSLAALVHYRALYPDDADGRVATAIRKAEAFLRSRQQPDGAYPGFWGINYTYALFHVVRALRVAGAGPADPALRLAGQWLMDKQRADGGWGEHYTGCLTGRYVEHSESQVVMTSWALLALLEILPPDAPAIQRGIDWLVERQSIDGDWPRQAVNGVFFGAAMLDYRLYPVYFPAWALARHARLVAGTERRVTA